LNCTSQQRAVIRSVAALLHEDLEEIGRSGLRYDKYQTVTEMDYPPIFAEGFTLGQICDGAVLLTYKSFQHDVQGHAVRCTERSSIAVSSRYAD
jgi:hypothetical protein